MVETARAELLVLIDDDDTLAGRLFIIEFLVDVEFPVFTMANFVGFIDF